MAAVVMATHVGRHALRLSRRRLISRALVLGGATVAASLAASVGPGTTGWRLARADDGPSGLIALPRGREIALVRPDGSDDRTILTLQPGEFIADVALSPDQRKIAFGMFTAGGNEAGG